MADEQPPSDKNLVQCEITKQWFPAHEIVEIQGHKVCSAGKEILLQRLKSGEPLPDEMERPTVLCRFGCIFLDVLILLVPILGIQYMAGMLHFPPRADPDVSVTIKVIVSVWSVALGLVYFGTLHGAKGKTLGKMAGKIKVVNLDGTPITMSKGYLRALCYSGPNLLSPVAILAGSQLGIKVLGYVGFAYFVVNVILALVDRNRQRALHDRLAGTRVIAIG
jgi:uncharacterized RDD family membrane protein YckC